MRFPRLLSLAVGVLAAGALMNGCAPADSGEEGEEGEAVATDTAADTQDVQGAVAAAPEHYSVAYENDAVRVVRVNYGPGESSAMHSHPAHCAVAVSDATMRMSPREGEAADLGMDAGEVVCVEAGAHSMENTGAEAAEVVLVEFKPGASAGSGELPEHPDAVTADPDHYTVEHENDVARILRIQYGPGETSDMHRHPANCAIFLQDQPTTFELPDGETVENPGYESGHVECWDAQAHLPTNTGDEALELILVELKGRAAWNGAGQGD